MGEISALGNAPGANPATETYSYDPLYRLTGISDSGTTLESYTYNQTGDRLSKTAPGPATGAYLYTTGTHQLSSIGNAPRASDANGNTTGSVVGGNTYGFGYNDRNRLALTQLNGVTVGTYTYNALGERIGKVAAATERYAYNEAGQLIGEYGSTNRDYVWVGSLPVAVIDNTINGSTTTSTVNYITADQLNTPRVVTNAAGTVIWSWAYQGNPFGEQQPTSLAGYVLNLRYPGQYYDAESGTNYNVNRNYEPVTGRYLQSDPVGLTGGTSTYAYVSNNPLGLSDVLGLLQQLSYTTISGSANSQSWNIQWQLSEPSPSGGWIVQTISGVLPDGSTITYSEAWQVNAGETETAISAISPFDDVLQGWPFVSATAEFYEGADLPDSYIPGGIQYAGSLPSRLGEAGLPQCGASNSVQRYFQAPMF